jgi:transposase
MRRFPPPERSRYAEATPPKFRARAVELAREQAKPVDQIAKDLGISSSCLRGWVKRADVDRGDRDG